jgi:hypothetical protein
VASPAEGGLTSPGPWEREGSVERFFLDRVGYAGDQPGGEEQVKDARLGRRFHAQLDTAAEALARCFKRDEPTLLEWVLAVDLSTTLPKINALLSTLTELRRQVLRSDARRIAAGYQPPEEGQAHAGKITNWDQRVRLT